ncbi:hypothetical protein [Aminipila sp.]|uniref:hypothetical protein n=1 Tax=Aminipila sp. TaxID=2060095 RepID=UPI00289882D9|nr:hypothetical protein [Aminipila sp.]
MIIVRNAPSFYDLITEQHLQLPTTLTGARRVARWGSCRPTSYWQYDFTGLDEEKLGKHLSTIYEGNITATFVSNFAVRFLNLAQKNLEEEL